MTIGWALLIIVSLCVFCFPQGFIRRAYQDREWWREWWRSR